MESDDTLQETSETTVEFERNLESLLLKAFSEGAAVEGRREIELPVDAAPDWTVEITKIDGDERSTYEPEFVNE